MMLPYKSSSTSSSITMWESAGNLYGKLHDADTRRGHFNSKDKVDNVDAFAGATLAFQDFFQSEICGCAFAMICLAAPLMIYSQLDKANNDQLE